MLCEKMAETSFSTKENFLDHFSPITHFISCEDAQKPEEKAACGRVN